MSLPRTLYTELTNTELGLPVVKSYENVAVHVFLDSNWSMPSSDKERMEESLKMCKVFLVYQN